MNKVLYFLSVFLVIALISACDNDNDTEEIIQVLTENDFANNSSIRADFENQTIVKFLEHPNSEENENDTGETGNDIIQVTYNRTVEHTFCWEDDNEEAEHFMEITNSEGILMLRLDANGDCVTRIIVAGDYIVTLFHDGLTEDVQPIFMIPTQNDPLEQEATNQIIQYYSLVKATTLSYLQNGFIKKVKAQTVQDNINTLLKTNKCSACVLTSPPSLSKTVEQFCEGVVCFSPQEFEICWSSWRGANLSGGDLSGADLGGANLIGANLSGANLSGADLGGANLINADLENANLSDANLGGTALLEARLSDANLGDANLGDANLGGANLSGANLGGANLSGAKLGDANLINADLGGATWCNGCTCFMKSMGMCDGCGDFGCNFRGVCR